MSEEERKKQDEEITGWGEEDEGKDKGRFKVAELPVATEKMYKYDPKKMQEKMLPRERGSPIYAAMKELYDADPMDIVDHRMYKRGGIQQCKTKVEFAEWGRRIAMERGIPSHSREMGIPMCQRTTESYKLAGTDTFATYDDINFLNNTAMQQMMDDLKRTIIVNLDIPHRTIQLRLGKEISPETMNLFMETLQHRLSGGAVIQEHMSEIHPALMQDGHAKVFTGDDDLAEQFDKRYIIDINKEFHPERAEQLKVGIGSKLCCSVHEPTHRVRTMDGGAIVRSAAQSTTMAFCAAYRLTGESILSDIAFSTRHAQQVRMGEPLWPSRSRAPNEPGGMPFGYLSDVNPADSDTPPIPIMECMATGETDVMGQLMGAMANGSGMWTELTTNAWYGQYMAGGVGFNAAGYTVLMGGFLDIGALTGGGGEEEEGMAQFGDLFGTMGTILGSHRRMPAKWRTMKPFIHMACHMVMDQFDKYPTMMEMAWGGAIRTFAVGYAGSMVAAMFTGDAQLTQMAANYGVAFGMKEGWLRTGWSGQEVQHHVGLAYASSLRPEEGGLPELKNCNTPYMSYTVGALGFPMFCYGSMLARGSSWSASPLIKVAFADRDLAFDFRNVVPEFAKACLREFEPAGERDIMRPAR